MVTLTQPAAQHIAKMLQKRGYGIGLRLTTKKSGCTGFAYVVDYADEIHEDDMTFDSHGVLVVMNQQDLEKVDGTEIDFQQNNLLNQGFEFRNPNVKDMCGCGESFSV